MKEKNEKKFTESYRCFCDATFEKGTEEYEEISKMPINERGWVNGKCPNCGSGGLRKQNHPK